MKRKLLLLFLACFFCAAEIFAQQKTITGKILDEDRQPLPGASVKVPGLPGGSMSSSDGVYSIKASVGQKLQFSYIGTVTQTITVGESNTYDIVLKPDANQLSEVQVTGALGIKTTKREQGSAIQTISGAEVAQTQRENFINSLQGRIAGVDVVATSGTPGASSQITIRGISSVSSNNQPLMVIDGVPMDNSTLSTGEMASRSGLENRTADFQNRSADINPEDIEDYTVLKGPEAAALYGIDAANGAILITTRRGKAGDGRISYNNSIRFDEVTKAPEVQRVYGVGRNGVPGTGYSIYYWGPKNDPNVTLYDNIKNFFETSVTQKHSLAFEGGTEKATYRISGTYNGQQGVVPNTGADNLNLMASTNATVKPWLKMDAAVTYSNSGVDGVFKGAGGPLLNLLVWPATDDAKNYLNPDGTRRTLNFDNESENPYFNVNKNWIKQNTSRVLSAAGLNFTLAKWLNLDTKVGYDTYVSSNNMLRHPESASAVSAGGIYDESTTKVRNLTLRATFMGRLDNVLPKFNVKFNLGVETRDDFRNTAAVSAEKFLEPNFVSVNNSAAGSRFSRTSITQRRLMGAYGSVTMDYNRLLYLTLTGRNDWSSTLPVESQSFFYPSASLSFMFTDLNMFKGIKDILNEGKFRASVAQVGRDASPYRVFSALEFKEVVGGGYGYGNYGPNPNLIPEMATSYELGTNLSFLKNRINLDFTYYNKRTDDQIIGAIRSSYATGYILAQLNGGTTRNWGYEVMLSGKPVDGKNFSWNVIANFAAQRSLLVKLPQDLPESYNSDTWLYGNIRIASVPGLPITSLTSKFMLRNDNGDILINPTNGLPINSPDFVPNGSDTRPQWNMGITNSFSYKNFTLNFLLDIRKGGDVMNATQHYLSIRGLGLNTLDRERPRIIKGVLRDGLENSANPTPNNITIIPYLADNFYITGNSEEPFIEKDINYIRLRDLTLAYSLSSKLLAKQRVLKSARVFVTVTDLFMITNYTGLDPVANGNTAAVNGSGGMGIDYGSFSIPTGFNIGLRIGL
jgi:TonB-linked SusC/RagA family outer membrane protein